MKKDIKYIIKRIVIGVAIALILGFLKTNNVFAEEINVNLDKPDIQFNDNGYLLYDLTSSYSSNTYNYKFPFDLSDENKSYIIFYNDNLNIYLYYFFTNISDYSVDIKDIKMNYDNKSNNFLYSYKCTSNNSNCDNDYMQIGGLDTSFYLSNKVIDDFSSLSTENILNKYDSPINNEYFYWKYGSAFPLENFSNDFKLFGTNLTSLTINNDNIYNSMNNYSEISISNNQAVYFVPKNYNDIQIETIQTGGSDEYPIYTNFIDFNYWIKGNIKSGWFPLNNIDDMFFADIPITSNDFLLIDTFFPMYQDGNSQSGYGYYAYIIFNNYDSISTIKYNSKLFNYYIIDDFSTYNQNICYIDRSSSEVCIDIDFSSNLNDFWLKGFNDENEGFVGNQEKPTNKLNNLFNLLKFPFNWLKSLTNSSNCKSINISIPFVGGNITINCLSNKFKEVLGNELYNIILYVLTGLYAYRITILNIDTITDLLDPTDDKLEVIDL